MPPPTRIACTNLTHDSELHRMTLTALLHVPPLCVVVDSLILIPQTRLPPRNMADEDGAVEEQVHIDYDAIDDATGFKVAELAIWRAFEEMLAKPEEDRQDVDAWCDEFSEEKKYDKKRVKFVVTMGIYAGARDEFNQRSGSGKAIYANGDVYEGDFFEGKKHGQGHYTFKKDGRSEVDTLLEKLAAQKPAGETQEAFVARASAALKIGTVIVESALEYGYYPCYHGDYDLGFRTGQGLMKNKDGSVYKGQWLKNKRHGQGLLYYVNGDVFSGEWQDGLKHGFGTYRFANGKGEYRGEWQKGNFVDGQWLMCDGNYYEGKFDKKNRPCDVAATLHFPSAKMAVSGVYKKGRWAPLNEFRVSEEVPAAEEWAA